MLLLADRYHLLALIACGGMAQVYAAHDRVTDRSVVVKRLKAELAFDLTHHSYCLYEAQLLARLSHPNIVELYDCGDDQGCPYLVLEHVPGVTMAQMLPLPPSQALHYVQQTAAALGYCHASGVVHGDIKPSNIMITPTGNVKLIDFGIATPIGSSPDGPLVGSPHYVAPERVLGNELTAASDVYSFGIALFELITGQLPFEGDDAAMIANLHVTELVPLMSEVLLSVPLSLERVVARATAPNPLARYADGNVLLNALYQTRQDLLGIPAPVAYQSVRGVGTATALWEKATGLIEHRKQMAA
ncbi:MAG: hypothetical protein NVSMB42_12820 [Herpetosiphon sp.]